MRKIIIGIHGLGNKPPEKILKTWWKKSIKEGLLHIGSSHTQFKFDFVYWANLLHEKPLDLRIRDKDHSLYLEDPYIPRKKDFIPQEPSEWRKKLFDKIEQKLDDIFYKEDSLINYEKIADLVIKNFFKDLAVYYQEDSVEKTTETSDFQKKIRNRLAATLLKYKKYDILLIAHSMGTIISYDVLTQTSLLLKINTLITLGSPLGLPIIIKKILTEQNVDYKVNHKPVTPNNVQKNWYNFADIEDKITINYKLSDDYKKNSNGVGPIDFFIDNDYEYKGNKNPHKAYGYLRSPEVADVIHRFLQPEGKFFIYLKNKLFSIFSITAEKIRTLKNKNKI